MKKKALLGKLVFILIIVVVLAGMTLYFKFDKGNIEFSTGNIVFNVEYNLSLKDNGLEDEEISIVDRIEGEPDKNDSLDYGNATNISA